MVYHWFENRLGVHKYEMRLTKGDNFRLDEEDYLEYVMLSFFKDIEEEGVGYYPERYFEHLLEHFGSFKTFKKHYVGEYAVTHGWINKISWLANWYVVTDKGKEQLGAIKLRKNKMQNLMHRLKNESKFEALRELSADVVLLDGFHGNGWFNDFVKLIKTHSLDWINEINLAMLFQYEFQFAFFDDYFYDTRLVLELEPEE